MHTRAMAVELVAAEHLAGRVVGRVHDDEPGPRGDRPAAGRPGRRPSPGAAAAPPGAAAPAMAATRRVGVVVGLEEDDLVADLAQGEDGGRHRLGGPGGDQDLGGSGSNSRP